MRLTIDEKALCEGLRPMLDDRDFKRGLENIANDRLLLSLFLMGTSLGEGLGEQGIAKIAGDDLAALLRDLRRQRLEEHGHMDSTRIIAEELFPDHFVNGQYLYASHVVGPGYYYAVRETNRARLRGLGKYSRFNLYMTTSFGYEIMVELFFRAVIEAVKRSSLPDPMRERVEFVLTAILSQEETHLGFIEQHNALLAADRSSLSPAAAETLDKFALLSDEDYRSAAELAVSKIVETYRAFADADAARSRVTASAAARQ
jgi:hypothetical protein